MTTFCVDNLMKHHEIEHQLNLIQQYAHCFGLFRSLRVLEVRTFKVNRISRKVLSEFYLNLENLLKF